MVGSLSRLIYGQQPFKHTWQVSELLPLSAQRQLLGFIGTVSRITHLYPLMLEYQYLHTQMFEKLKKNGFAFHQIGFFIILSLIGCFANFVPYFPDLSSELENMKN